MTRITPRTCLWPLAISLVITFGLSVGLTFRSNHHCYAGTCGEWLFPLQARLHVVIWYSWLSLSVTFFAVRAFHPQMQKILAKPLARWKTPLINKEATVGGTIMAVWTVSLYGVVVGVWWIQLRDYFEHRNVSNGIQQGGHRLAAIALTGHLCDITMGMVLLPVSRHSALASFFHISVSTTLTFHVLMAYTLFSLVTVHGLLYVSWLPVFNSLPLELQRVVPVLNPTYLYTETWPGNSSSLGVWRASLIFTGSTAALIMLLILMTTFPKVRTLHFNLFYFTHLGSIVMVIIICLHASTMFYCTSPGLAMWCLDWGMRFHELRGVLHGRIAASGNGWYWYVTMHNPEIDRADIHPSITLPLPRARLKGCSCRSALAHFYIHHAGSSIRELHPFTTITHLASKNRLTPAEEDDFQIQFLFRKSGKKAAMIDQPQTALSLWRRMIRSKEKRVRSTQWTQRLATLADECKSQVRPSKDTHKLEFGCLFLDDGVQVDLRLEGPYFSPADTSRYDTVVCLVAGTGVSGAVAIAAAFNATVQEASDDKSEVSKAAEHIPRWRRCVIIWSVKETDDIDLPFIEPMATGLELRKYLTGDGRRRVDMTSELQEVTAAGGKTWVYISGPTAFLNAGKQACEEAKRLADLDYYAASWDI